MTETTESSEAAPHQPLKIAAPWLALLGAVSGALIGGAACEAVLGKDLLFVGVTIAGGAVGAVVLGRTGHRFGSRIDGRGYPPNGGWRGLLVFFGSFGGLLSGVALMSRVPVRSPLLTLLVCTGAVLAGTLFGARIGETLDRRREITGESPDAEDEP